MMALAHDAQRVTDDVDSHIRRGREAVTKAVAEIAGEVGLSKYWLKEAITPRHLPEDPDRGERRVYINTQLTIDGTSTRRMVATKLHAGRSPDLADLDILQEAAGITTRREAERLHGNVGPESVRRALAEILPPEEEPESWLRRFHGEVAGRTRSPAPTLWNSPALVVTGAMASRALCAALEHEAAYPAETIDSLMREAGVAETDVAVMFKEVTGKPLRARVTRTAARR